MKDINFICFAYRISEKDKHRLKISTRDMRWKGFLTSEEYRGCFSECLPGAVSIGSEALGMTDMEFCDELDKRSLDSNRVLCAMNDYMFNRLRRYTKDYIQYLEMELCKLKLKRLIKNGLGL